MYQVPFEHQHLLNMPAGNNAPPSFRNACFLSPAAEVPCGAWNEILDPDHSWDMREGILLPWSALFVQFGRRHSGFLDDEGPDISSREINWFVDIFVWSPTYLPDASVGSQTPASMTPSLRSRRSYASLCHWTPRTCTENPLAGRSGRQGRSLRWIIHPAGMLDGC